MSTAFVGRSAELSRARDALEHVQNGSGALLFFTGEPGIGKTCLADRTASLAAEQGMKVVWGRCWEAGGAPSYWPWIEVFRGLGVDSDPFASELSQGGNDARQGRFHLFDQAVRTLTEASRQKPLVIVLDDLHAADVPSLLVLQLLARGLRGAPILVVGTYREVEARLCPELAPLLAKIAREGQVISLARLSQEEVALWLAREPVRQTVAPADVLRLTEGNPLFISEALRVAASGQTLRPSQGVDSLLEEHLSRLSARGHALLEAASVLGREFAVDPLLALFDAPLDEAHVLFTEAQAAGVISASDKGFVFSHILLRDKLYGGLPPSRRAELHWRAGEKLAQSGADLGAASHHLIEGHSAGQIERVLEV
ncbi:MAG TPA: AAA family ATPase, partial [Polyangiaceae bacterium]|nr:AAA family ATPase [Polyangiaceae bacterium]